jgi:hypothetical protein
VSVHFAGTLREPHWSDRLPGGHKTFSALLQGGQRARIARHR